MPYLLLLLMCLRGLFEWRAIRRQQLAELTPSPTVAPALGEAAP